MMEPMVNALLLENLHPRAAEVLGDADVSLVTYPRALDEDELVRALDGVFAEHLHRNVPGVLAAVNGILADHGVNVEGQLLGTRAGLGYVLSDIGVDYAPDVVQALHAMPETVRLRVLS
jgi:hypothetical protein